MPFDCARAEKQPGGDLWVGKSVSGEEGDLLLLSCEVIARLDAPLAYFSPVACSSRRARPANASMPIAANISWAARS